MKKAIKILLLITIIGLLALSLIACGANANTEKETEQPTERKILEVYVDKDTIPESVYVGEVKLTQIMLIVKYEDGETERVALTDEIIDVASQAKLKSVGTQKIGITYQDKYKASFILVILDPNDVKYSLKISGGKPVAVNGSPVSVAGEDNYFEGAYDRGTKVTIDWLDEEGKIFDYWECNGEKIDTQRRTVVVMDGEKEYVSHSEDLLYTVSFVSFNQSVSVAPIENRKVLETRESIISALEMDDYVFVGWTEREISQTQALSGEINSGFVSFPYEIQKNTTFYAVWAPIGFSYTTVSIQMASGRKDGKQIVSYSGKLTDLSIPSRSDGQDVISIAKDAFSGENAKLLMSVSIPSTVVQIEEGAFRNCSSLQSFYVDVANQYYSADRGTLYRDNKSILVSYPLGRVAATYAIEPSVMKIANYAFNNAIVGSIELPAGVKSIGAHAFDSVHIDNVDFTKLEREKLTNVGENVFSQYLKSIKTGEGDGEKEAYQSLFPSQSDLIFNGREGTVSSNSVFLHEIDTEKGETVSILFRLIYLNSGASRTAEIIGITRTIESIVIPDSLEGRGTDFVVSSIGDYAFKDCFSLENVVLPKSLSRVCDNAFDDTIWAKNLENDSIIANDTLYKYLGQEAVYILPESVAYIAEGAFRGNKAISNVDITTNSILQSIGDYAFADCINLKGFAASSTDNSFLIKPSLIKVGEYAFYKTALTRIETQTTALDGNGLLQKIGDFAFSENYYLEKADIRMDSLEAIGKQTFFKCYALEEINVSDGNAVFASFDGILYKRYDDAFSLFCYPSGKMTEVFNPSCPGGNYINVVDLGDYSLYYSNIGALEFEESVPVTNGYAIYIPSLAYVSFKNQNNLHDASYSVVFERTEARKFVFDENLDETYIIHFFGNDEEKANELSCTEVPFNIFRENGLLYAVSTSSDKCLIVGSDRSASSEEIEIPLVVTIEGLNYDEKTVGKYAFTGYNLRKLIVNGVSSFENHALKNAFVLDSLYLNEENVERVPTIFAESLGDRFNDDLLVYVACDPEAHNSYFDKWDGIIDTFTYAAPSGEMYTASKNLIYNEAFIVLTYLDKDNVRQTASIERGMVQGADVVAVNDKRDGYSVGGWFDLYNETPIVLFDGYPICNNLVLDCEWIADTYELLFVVPKAVTLNFDAQFISEDDSTVTYSKSFIFGSDYDFGVTDADSNAYNFNGWIVNGTTIPSRGTWSITSSVGSVELHIARSKREYRIEYDRTNIDEIAALGKTVYFGESYTLTIPKRNGHTFKGWKMISAKGVETVLTNGNGASLTEWNIVTADSVTVYAIWEAASISVQLKLDDETEYGTATIVFESEDYVLSFDPTKLSTQAQNIYREKVNFFAGWKDASGKIYTDSDGKAIVSWDKFESSVLYAIWPEFVEQGDDIYELIRQNPQVSIVLMTDLALSNMIDVIYMGVFNGNGHKITLNGTYTNEDVGLFRRNDGTIKNFTLEADIEASFTENGADDKCVGIVCVNNSGIIDNVTVIVQSLVVTIAPGEYLPVTIGAVTAVNIGTISCESTSKESINVEIRHFEITTNTAPELTVGVLVGINAGNVSVSMTDIKDFSVVIGDESYSGGKKIGSVIGENTAGTVSGGCRYKSQGSDDYFADRDKRVGELSGGNIENLSFSLIN